MAKNNTCLGDEYVGIHYTVSLFSCMFESSHIKKFWKKKANRSSHINSKSSLFLAFPGRQVIRTQSVHCLAPGSIPSLSQPWTKTINPTFENVS